MQTGVNCVGPHIHGSFQLVDRRHELTVAMNTHRAVNGFSLPSDFLNDIFFSLAYLQHTGYVLIDSSCYSKASGHQ